MCDDRIVLNDLDDLARARSEGDGEVLRQLIEQCVAFLQAQGVAHHRIAAIATPAVFEAYRKYLTEFADAGWASIERDIRGGLPH